MLEPRGDADLAQEALGPERVSQLGMQDLERHRPVVPEVPGEIDRGHAAAAELALDHVAVGQRGLEAGSDLGQVDGPTRSYPLRVAPRSRRG